jgi:hypothetical protein
MNIISYHIFVLTRIGRYYFYNITKENIQPNDLGCIELENSQHEYD